MTGQQTKRFHRPGTLSRVTAQLEELLKTGNPGDVWTDARLAQLCGRDTRPGQNGYRNLRKAIDGVRDLYGIVWYRDSGTNRIRCLHPSEVMADGDADRRSARRKAERGSRKVETVNVGDLDPSERPRANALKAQLGTMAIFMHGHTTRRLAERAASETMPSKDILRLFEK